MTSFICDFAVLYNSSSTLESILTSVLQVVRTLRSRYPIMRRNTAEQLYECLASECDSNNETERNKRLKLLNLLSETKWNITGDEQCFVKVSHLIAEMLNVVS